MVPVVAALLSPPPRGRAAKVCGGRAQRVRGWLQDSTQTRQGKSRQAGWPAVKMAWPTTLVQPATAQSLLHRSSFLLIGGGGAAN